MGYDKARTWRNLLCTHRNDIAAAMNIPANEFRWYAAFHDEGNHPHIHMMAWSAGDALGYLSPVGIEKIKSMLTNDIFRQEMLHIYEQKSQSRDELMAEARRVMLELAGEMKRDVCECQRQPENVDFRRNRMSFFGGQHSGVYSPYTQSHLLA